MWDGVYTKAQAERGRTVPGQSQPVQARLTRFGEPVLGMLDACGVPEPIRRKSFGGTMAGILKIPVRT